jgi:hypothetical protein
MDREYPTTILQDWFPEYGFALFGVSQHVHVPSFIIHNQGHTRYDVSTAVMYACFKTKIRKGTLQTTDKSRPDCLLAEFGHVKCPTQNEISFLLSTNMHGNFELRNQPDFFWEEPQQREYVRRYARRCPSILSMQTRQALGL